MIDEIFVSAAGRKPVETDGARDGPRIVSLLFYALT